jgi:hypothetical protein
MLPVMRLVLVIALLAIALDYAAAQQADCPTEPSSGGLLPLALNLDGRKSGVPSGTTGQAYVFVPLAPPGVACREPPARPADILHGAPGDLLRGPGTPHVRVEVE